MTASDAGSHAGSTASLASSMLPEPSPQSPSPVSRRGLLALLSTGIAIAATGRSVAASAVPAAPSAAAHTPPAAVTQSTSLPAQQTNLGPARAVQAGGGRLYQAGGAPVVVTHPSSGTYRAFNGICPHAGCTCSGMPVPNDPARTTILCPCHGSEFNATTGAVVRGPAAKGLAPLRLRVSRGRLLLG